MIRAFIAIEVDAAVRRRLAEMQHRLMTQFRATGLQSAVRPVAVKQIHLTLCFLGEIEESYIDPLAASLQQVGEHWREGKTIMHLSITQLGGFPNLKRPRVLWCGVDDQTGGLMTLQDAVTQAVAPWHPKEEGKPFHPHLTLFRVKTYDQTQLRRIGEIVRGIVAETDAGWPVTEIKFFRSDLFPSGPAYTTLAIVSLGPA